MSRISIDSSLSLAETDHLLASINGCPGFTRMSRDDFACDTRNGMLVLREGGTAIGVHVHKNFAPQWNELHVLFVVPERRSLGYGKILFTEALKTLKDSNLFLVTNNTLVKRMARANDFHSRSLARMPLPILLHMLRSRIKPSKIYALLQQLWRRDTRLRDFVYFVKVVTRK